MAETDSLALIRKDHTLLAASVTNLANEIAAMKTAKAVESECDIVTELLPPNDFALRGAGGRP